MKLANLASEIWKNSTVMEITPTEIWDEDFFLKQWFDNNEHNDKYTKTSPGWYWIGCEIDFQDLKDISPTVEKELQKSACKISDLARRNFQTFSTKNLCKKNKNASLIIYNGHQSNIINRVRQHFMLNNNRTGAIGLRYYPLSGRKWTIIFFGKRNIKQLRDEDQPEVERLIREKSGRVAIESAWRAYYGWPILCKE